ncbi:unnamed protein product [Schistosoma turkestanicum]|nr:unnamed protein product [Schistosoma turkestanicum]
MKKKSKCYTNSDSPNIDNTITSSTGYCSVSHENLSPTTTILLPRNLLDSPIHNDKSILPLTLKNKQKNSYQKIPIMHLKAEKKSQNSDNNIIDSDTTMSTMINGDLNKINEKRFTGFYFKTTYSDVNFIIKDPFIIEKLILLPMTKLFLYLLKKTQRILTENEPNYKCSKTKSVHTITINKTNDYSCQMIHCKRVLMELYEHYIVTYGYLKHTKLFIKYALKDFPDCIEKSRLLKLLHKNKTLMNVSNKSDEFLSQHENNHDDTRDFILNNDRISSECQSPSSSSSSYTTKLHPFQSSSFSLNEYHSQRNQLFSSDWFNNYSSNIINMLPFEFTDNPSQINEFTSNYIIQTNTKISMKISSGNSQNKNASLFNIHYKTQLCKYFQEHSGYCPVGVRCHFAHGIEELRDPKSHPKFRSQTCRNYSVTGNCLYGDKCYFKHFIDDLSSTKNETTSELEIFNNKENLSPDSTSQSGKYLFN